MASYDNKVLTGDQLVYFSGLVKTALASKADSSALSSKQDSLVFNTAYNASTNKVATMADLDASNINYTIANETDSVANTLDSLIATDESIMKGELIEASMIKWGEDPETGDTIYADRVVATVDYVSSAITTALSGISSFSFEIVQSLPQSNISTSKIYLVAKQTSGTNQVYTEYAYVNNAWEIIGDTSMTIDTLSNAEVATIWNTATASAS